MAYQIPNNTKATFLLEETVIDLYRLTMPLHSPPQDLIFKHATVTMYIKGLLGADFKMRINVYSGDGSLLFSSSPVNNLDIERVGDYYAEIRFDFPRLGNLMSAGKSHMVEFEIYDGYVQDSNNFVAIIMSPLGVQSFLGSSTYDLSDAVEIGAVCSFFFDINNDSSERFLMCRIQGAKLFNGITTQEVIQFFPARILYTATIQTGLYVDSFALTVAGANTTIIDHMSDFTPDPMNPDTNLNKYYYNPLTGEVKFYLGYQLQDTVYAIMEYFIFFTDTRGKYAAYNLSSGFDVVYWEARLSPDLSFEFSQSNNLQGLLSISSAPISLKNQDLYLNSFLTENDTFSNREVKCWSCDGSVGDNKVEFIGVIRGVSVSDNECVFTIADPLAKLDNVYVDGLPKTALDLATSGSYFIRIEDVAKPVSRLLGKISSFSYLGKYTAQTIDVPWMSPEKMINCTNINFNNVPLATNNRHWSVGFGPSSATTQQRDVTAVANYTSGTFSATKFTIDAALGPISEWLPIGTCIVNNGQYGIVYESNATEAYVWPHNASFSAAADIIRHKVISVIIEQDGVLYYPLAGRDYTCQIGAAGDLQIVFVNVFEAALSMATTLNPFEDQVYAVMMNDDADNKSSEIVNTLLIDARMTVNATFAPDQTPAWTDAELAITIPFPGQSAFPSFREVVELCLKSSMSFLYFDQSGYLRYKSFMQDIQTDPTLTDNQSGFDVQNQINQSNSKGFSVRLDLWDLYGGASFDFSHCKMYYSWIIQYQMVKDFYQTENLYEVETVIDPTRASTSDFLDSYAALVMGRSAIFSVTALAEHMGLYIGDDIEMSRRLIQGQAAEATLRVVSLSKSVNEVRMDLMDLKKFPTL